MKKLVIFDLDGTLTDTSRDICDSLNISLKKFGYPEITVAEAVRFAGNGARKLVERALKGAPCDNFEEVLAFYNATYNYCGSPRTTPYRGIKTCLRKLKKSGYMLAIVSNKPQEGTNEVVKKFFSDIQFDLVSGGKEGAKLKPDRSVVEGVLKELSVDKSQALFVGDSEVDAATALNAGVDLISVLWGFRQKEELIAAGAYRFVTTPAKLYGEIAAL